jgi:hypothetical protein
VAAGLLSPSAANWAVTVVPTLCRCGDSYYTVAHVGLTCNVRAMAAARTGTVSRRLCSRAPRLFQLRIVPKGTRTRCRRIGPDRRNLNRDRFCIPVKYDEIWHGHRGPDTVPTRPLRRVLRTELTHAPPISPFAWSRIARTGIRSGAHPGPPGASPSHRSPLQSADGFRVDHSPRIVSLWRKACPPPGCHGTTGLVYRQSTGSDAERNPPVAGFDSAGKPGSVGFFRRLIGT